MSNFYIIGDPIKQSKSPLLFNYIFRKMDLKAEYKMQKISQLKTSIDTLKTNFERDKEVFSISVTNSHPLKRLPNLDNNKLTDINKPIFDYMKSKKNSDIECIGDLGVKSSCTYKGLFFIQVDPATPDPLTVDTESSLFIEEQLKNDDHIWRICTWAKNMNSMQLGEKGDRVGWKVYENCKNAGAIIATAHEHTYSRTKTLINIENQIVDAQWSEPDKLKVEDGATFVFVSGLGGKSIRDQDRCLPISYPYGCNEEWANIIKDSNRPLLNRNTSGQYPPGSIFKLITLFPVVEEKKILSNWETFCGASSSNLTWPV